MGVGLHPRAPHPSVSLTTAGSQRRSQGDSSNGERAPSVSELRAVISATGDSPSTAGKAAHGGDLWIPMALPIEPAEAMRPVVLTKPRSKQACSPGLQIGHHA